MARVIVRKAAAKTSDTQELYTLAAESISDVDERKKFMTLVTGEKSVSAIGGSSTGGSSTGTQPLSVRKGKATQTSPPQSRSLSGMTRPLAPLDQEFVDQTTSRLAVYLGPVARIVAKKAAQKAGTQQEFVQLVAGHLGAQERGAFLRELGYEDIA
jgi:serine/threonine-protein kinase